VPTGAWAEFRKAAGLEHPISIVGSSATRDDGKLFEYFLVTGKEAQMVATGASAAVRCLRFGSSGQDVKALQEQLATQAPNVSVDKTGTVDRKTLGAVIRWQIARKIAPTGIVAADVAASLGLKWT
jgi:peptidoglycan hydrolase-like protein with peptidoglycan-binding domain